MNDKQENRKAMERWERINDYGDAGVKHNHKEYKHQANKTLRRKAKEGLLTYKPSTGWHGW